MLDYPKFKIRFWQGGKGFFTSSLISFSRKRKSRVFKKMRCIDTLINVRYYVRNIKRGG